MREDTGKMAAAAVKFDETSKLDAYTSGWNVNGIIKGGFQIS
jgi:hypothetical protein